MHFNSLSKKLKSSKFSSPKNELALIEAILLRFKSRNFSFFSVNYSNYFLDSFELLNLISKKNSHFKT